MRVKMEITTIHNVVLPDSITVANEKSTIMYDCDYNRGYVIYAQDSDEPDWTVGIDTEGFDGKVEISGCVKIIDDDYPDSACEVYCKCVPINEIDRGISEAIKAIEDEENSVLNKSRCKRTTERKW